MTEPKNISGAYPLAGERVGPAWRDIWAELDKGWTDGPTLAARVAQAHGLERKTVDNLLRAGRKAGVLESRVEGRPGLQRAQYRVTRTS
jgi:GTP-sensing pleiotropic transcriptional regulator CodY